MLAIVASEFDIHTDAVILALRERNFGEVLRIDLETALDRFQFTISASAEFAVSLRSQARVADDLSELRSVWWRRSSSQIGMDYLNVPTREELDRAEAYWAARWLMEAIPPTAFPLGHPYALRAAENKLAQLRVAPRAGLSPPSSLVSNDKERLLAFFAQQGEVVVKPLHTSVVSSGEAGDVALFAHAVQPAELSELLAAAPSACLFVQERVLKAYDVRVNVFPSRTVACRIDPAPGASGVDWRPDTAQCPHTIIDLPAEIEAGCRKFLQLMGLKWGAFDFGVTSRGEWVFFECNPNGQWLWIELQTKYPLAGVVASELLAHHSK